MQRTAITDQDLGEVEPAIRDAVVSFHPGVVFTDIWVKQRISWCGDDMVDVWAIYEGQEVRVILGKVAYARS